ncbi:MAG: lactate dehydrogenase-like 2-hydroxyacid dehydrogenase [Paraglaciecola sp.]|jgi:lactate dehydrogenase-like 2-hydroxyacid dehydrogenase
MSDKPVAEVILTANLPAQIEQKIVSQFSTAKILLQDAGTDDFIQKMGRPTALVVIPGDPINARLISLLPESIKLIASYSAGLDHVDIDAARARNIEVSNTPDVLTDATADIAILLILGAVRGAGNAASLITNHAWKGWEPRQIFGYDLKNKTLGIMGPGRIGQATARRASAFGLNLVYWGLQHVPAIEQLGAKPILDLKDFLGEADILSLHLPATNQTRNIINQKTLSMMKPGSFLINTARGDLLDDDAVIEALASGHLAGIGLDVFSGEPNIHSGYLSSINTFLLPHIGSSTHETRQAMGDMVIASLQKMLRG